MKHRIVPIFTICILAVLIASNPLIAQDKNVVKLEEMILKAEQEEDAAKKRALYLKAGNFVREKGLNKDENAKIGDSYLYQGDVTNAVKYYMRCDKEEKAAGYVRAGDELVDQAMYNQKKEGSFVRKAISYYKKAKEQQAGYVTIGDAYYAKGPDHKMKAAEYYGKGKAEDKIDKVAGELLAQDKKAEAAGIYMMLTTTSGLKKAGDLYYDLGNYEKAYEAYDKGEVASGIIKYADKLDKNGEMAEADLLYQRAGEIYAKNDNKEGMKKLAKTAEDKGKYGLVANLYTQSGDSAKAQEALAYDKLAGFEFFMAEEAFSTLGMTDMVNAIKNNMRYLDPLGEAGRYLDEVKSYEPAIEYATDSTTGKRTANPADVEANANYYAEVKNPIIDACYKVSLNLPKLTDAKVKSVMTKRFKQYKPVNNILTESFSKKGSRSSITNNDVKM